MSETKGRGTGDHLTRFAVWAEIVAVVAVVVSLVFVGVQVRQSTAETVLNRRVAEATAYQSLQEQLAVITTMQIENPDLRRVMSRVSDGETLETPADEDDWRPYSLPPDFWDYVRRTQLTVSAEPIDRQ